MDRARAKKLREFVPVQFICYIEQSLDLGRDEGGGRREEKENTGLRTKTLLLINTNSSLPIYVVLFPGNCCGFVLAYCYHWNVNLFEIITPYVSFFLPLFVPSLRNDIRMRGAGSVTTYHTQASGFHYTSEIHYASEPRSSYIPSQLVQSFTAKVLRLCILQLAD